MNRINSEEHNKFYYSPNNSNISRPVLFREDAAVEVHDKLRTVEKWIEIS
jgi:hypothetical protein